ncbi:MAG TPA: CHRD domain-containing protein [Thermoanaerobaculia bacterium]|nr:CHRD domain-containing protein [Thermoanaerobaculia bacterium]
MKKLVIVLTIVLLAPALAGAQTLTATLLGSNEVGGGAPAGSGIAVVSFDGTSITYTILVSGIDAPTAAHIHVGAAGTDGNVVVDFQPSFVAGTATGTVSGDASTVAAILASPAGHYVNVHTSQFPDGAVRGQLSSVVATPQGHRVSYLPVAGRAPGANETLFVTDLRVVNTGGSPADVTLEWWPAAASGATSPAVTDQVVVAPGEQLVLDDVLQTSFGVAQALGVIRIVSDQPVNVTTRIINDQRANDAGTTGFAFDASALEDAASSGILPFLAAASSADLGAGLGFRTNLGYFNPHGAAVSLTLVARRTSDGSVLGSKTLDLVPFAISQPVPVFAMIDTVSEADRVQDDFYVTYEATAPLFVYASVTDNRSGDGVLVQ